MIMDPDPSTHGHSVQTRPSLLFRLRDWQDAASWEEFYRLYHKLVFSLALRSGLARAEAEEVAQDVFKRVAETIHEFESDPARGSFRGWLMNLTRWRITDKFRERARLDRLRAAPGPGSDGDRTSTINRVPDQTAPAGAHDPAWENEWQHHVLDAALARLARRVPARHFQAFELYSRQGWTVMRVARELNLGAATVYVISHRLTKQLKVEVEKLRAQLG
jgi:RNA polymerase sigma-70 factor (ECF subfamily)